MLRWLRNTFFAGLIVLLPIVATVYIIFAIFAALDRIVRPITEMIYGQSIYGLGVVLTLSVILLAGIIVKNIVGRRVFALSEWVMNKIPLVRKVYGTVKQISDALFGNNAVAAFKQVVLVEYPRRGIYQLGFLTGAGIGEIQGRTQERVVNVFIPTTPNPTSGMLILVPEKDMAYLDMTVEEGIKVILSGGVLVPKWKEDLQTEENHDDKY